MTAKCLVRATQRLDVGEEKDKSQFWVDGVHVVVLDALKVLTCFLMNSTAFQHVKDDRETRPLLNLHIALMCLAFWDVAGCFAADYREDHFIHDIDELIVELIFSALITLAH